MKMRHIYQVIDGGESYMYSAESKELAMECHVDLNYTTAGVPLEDADINDEIIEISDDKILNIGGHDFENADENGYVKMSAKEWAEKVNGLVASTLY